MTEEIQNGLTAPNEAAHVAEEAPVDQNLESATNSEPEDEVKSEKPKGISPDKVQRRIDDLTRKRYEAEGRAKAIEQRAAYAEAQLAELTGRSSPSTAAPEVDIETKAQRIAEERLFNDKCNSIYNNTVKEFPDFKENFASLTSVTGPLDNKTLEVLIETDAPSKVLKYLADNPDEAVDLLSYTPTRLAREIAKLEIKLDQDKPKASSAPKPISPVKSSGSSSSTPDPSDIAAWIAHRNKQELDRKRGR